MLQLTRRQDWNIILDLHTAILSDIERGHRHWKDSTLDIEFRVFSGANMKRVSRQGAFVGNKGIEGETSIREW